MRLAQIAGLAAALAAAAAPGRAQEAPAAPRPHILGLAHVALFVHDIDRSRSFYKDFLGFDEPFWLKNKDGSLHLTWIKVNDHQAIELFPEKEPGSDRLYQISFETDDAEAMRLYLKSKGVAVPDHMPMGKSGTANFSITDPDGHAVEFVQFLPTSWIVADYGKHLPDTRIALRMPHAGILVRNLAASLKFYGDLLGFRETWRGSKNGKTLSWVNMAVPDGRDYVEFMLYDTVPPLARRGTMHHVCLEVADVAATSAILKARPMPAESKPATNIAVGVNGRRQINYYDPDGTRVEVMEPQTADGKPVPPSSAPPPGQPAGG
jgi:catechol 2,3-dioxygenase-like lactoylglutathione lyase family enzyme